MRTRDANSRGIMIARHRRLALAFVVLAGCSAGTAAGTSGGSDPGTSNDAGRADASHSDGGSTVVEEPDADPIDATAPTDASRDTGGRDVTTADVVTDAGVTDAGADAAKDATANDASADAAKDAAPDVDAALPLCTVDDGAWVAGAAQYHIVAKGTLWRISSTGALVSSTALSTMTGWATGPCAGQVGTCHIDAMTWREDVAEYHVVHGGKLWRLDDHGVLLGSTALTSYPGIASGPCSGKTGTACTFEAGAWRDDLLEYHLVTGGTIYAIDKDGGLVGSTPLTSYTGVAAGPCFGQVGTCHVDAFTYRPDKSEYHVIAKGSLYVIDTAGTLVSATLLTSFDGMAQGPCK